MSRVITIVLGILLAVGATGCFIRPRNLPEPPVPIATPDLATATPPWVLTATLGPQSASPSAATLTPTGQNETGGTAAAPQSSDVKAVLVKDDVRMRTGPGSDYPILGLVHAGDKLVVTGASDDGAWWQVECELGPDHRCWISSDPELTEPTQP